MLDAPDLEAITVKLQAKMLKAAMTEAASASDETVLRVLDAFAEPWCDRGGYQPHHVLVCTRRCMTTELQRS